MTSNAIEIIQFANICREKGGCKFPAKEMELKQSLQKALCLQNTRLYEGEEPRHTRRKDENKITTHYSDRGNTKSSVIDPNISQSHLTAVI